MHCYFNRSLPYQPTTSSTLFFATGYTLKGGVVQV